MRYKRAFLSGLCGASLIRGFRHGFADLKFSSIVASDSVKNVSSQLLRDIPVRTLQSFLGSKSFEIRLTVQAYRGGELPFDEALTFLSLLVMADPKMVLEIGTFFGDTTKLIAANLPNAIIHTVDLPPNFDPTVEKDSEKDDFHLIAARKVGDAFRNTDYARQIVQHFADSATWDFSAAKGATFFFIDGSHTYHYCKSDSEKCYALCDGKGVFVWHDCNDNHPGVLEFIAEWRKMGREIVRLENTPLCYWSSL